MKKWYVVQDIPKDVNKQGKFADGYYGWDSSILEDEQIFGEDELPYKPNYRMKFIQVAQGHYKPSPNYVRGVLKVLGK